MTNETEHKPSGDTTSNEGVEWVLDVWIDEETGKVSVHLDGIEDKNMCKETLIAFLADAGINEIGEVTITSVTRPSGGGSRTKRKRRRRNQSKDRN